MGDNAVRNFRDFLTIYNSMSQTCFQNCVASLQDREITRDEEQCVDMCASKHIRVNHKLMTVYVEVQPLIIAKRVEQMEKEAALAAEKEAAKIAANPVETEPVVETSSESV